MKVQDVINASDAELHQMDRRVIANVLTRLYNLPLRDLWRFTLAATWWRVRSCFYGRAHEPVERWWE